MPKEVANFYEVICQICSKLGPVGRLYIRYCLWNTPYEKYMAAMKHISLFLQGFGEGMAQGIKINEEIYPEAYAEFKRIAQKHGLCN